MKRIYILYRLRYARGHEEKDPTHSHSVLWSKKMQWGNCGMDIHDVIRIMGFRFIAIFTLMRAGFEGRQHK